MALSEFRELSFGPQMAILARDGTPLLSRMEGKEQRVLFSLHAYYVEVGWDWADRLQYVRSFSHTNGLDAYLPQLDWYALA